MSDRCRPLAVVCLAGAGLLLVSSCRPSRYYLLEPSAFGQLSQEQRWEQERVESCESECSKFWRVNWWRRWWKGYTTGECRSACREWSARRLRGRARRANFILSDSVVVAYGDAVKVTLRQRLNTARWAREGAGFAQIILSATSAMVTGTAAPGRAAAEAATVLSGTSSIIPEVSSVIGAKERAEVYAQAIKDIETAEAKYVNASAASEAGVISRTKLTPAAADYYQSVVASVHVVEARLAAQLPSDEDLRKAKGEFDRLEVNPTSLTLAASGQKATIQVLHGGPISTATSSDDTIAAVKIDTGNMSATVTGGANATRSASVVLTNGRGGTANVAINSTTTTSTSTSTTSTSVGATTTTLNPALPEGGADASEF
jgi:hypothetical protein